ncbi:MAG: hypothetical protein JJU02_06675 [Cryomorphaceae bacterium]|nr:hypothetical protein [Cryomorphaceae bacterium]
MNQYNLKQKGEETLNRLLEKLSKSEKIIDGFLIENLSHRYNRYEIRLSCNLHEACILARFDLFTKDGNLSIKIGYYDNVVNLNGDFVDEFLVFE